MLRPGSTYMKAEELDLLDKIFNDTQSIRSQSRVSLTSQTLQNQYYFHIPSFCENEEKGVPRQLHQSQEANWLPSLQEDLKSLCIQTKGPAKSFPVKALYDYTATRPDECSFNVGDLLTVDDSSNDWWLATNLRTKKKGLIPNNYVTSDMSVSNVLKAWFDVDRMGAERKLLMPGVLPGTYILRPCESAGNPYSLSVRTNGVKIKHFRVYFDESTKRFYLWPSVQFPSLEEMISYYHSESIDGEISLIEARPRRVAPPLSFKDCFIHYEDIKLVKELGRGNFGAVYLGRILSMEVAVKKCLNIKDNQAFRDEAEVMHKLSHQRIMRFLGFCCDAPDNRVLIITEFMPNGALRDYLKTAEGRRLDYRHLISIIDQVVKGMVYLEKVGVVHRDLRAANVLVDADGSVKIADFGLTKILDFSQNFTEDALPFRWTALEAMKRSYQPDTKADVWSFGVFMFEVLTYGKTPFEGYNLRRLLEFLLEGGRLSSPRTYGFECDETVYAIMKSCWNAEPEKRPSFKEISHEIENFIRAKEGSYEACWEKMVEN
ncbi:Tyrosine-protein kinase SPK-1 [Taenia crassiceps]|uniref:Tyrosine-protein kinase n=1 Tax=Taenia crassiceps TaxID=6207 RepID=A0ABR4Q682_9CEST